MTSQHDSAAELHLNRDEASLLVFLETCLVDYGGTVEGRRMNSHDFDAFDHWIKSGFIKGGRIGAADLNKRSRPVTHWVEFTDESWRVAHQLRKDRAARMLERIRPGGDMQIRRNGA